MFSPSVTSSLCVCAHPENNFFRFFFSYTGELWRQSSFVDCVFRFFPYFNGISTFSVDFSPENHCSLRRKILNQTRVANSHFRHLPRVSLFQHPGGAGDYFRKNGANFCVLPVRRPSCTNNNPLITWFNFMAQWLVITYFYSLLSLIILGFNCISHHLLNDRNCVWLDFTATATAATFFYYYSYNSPTFYDFVMKIYTLLRHPSRSRLLPFQFFIVSDSWLQNILHH